MSNYNVSDFCKAYGWVDGEVTMRLDGMFIHKPTGTELGTVFELKIDIENRLRQKEREIKKAKRESELNELVPAAIEILKNSLPSEAKVYKNRTMPNVELGGVKYYVVLGNSLDRDVIVRFHHPDFVGEQVSKYTGYRVKFEEGRENNCIISGLSIEQAASVIEKVSDLTGE